MKARNRTREARRPAIAQRPAERADGTRGKAGNGGQAGKPDVRSEDGQAGKPDVRSEDGQAGKPDVRGDYQRHLPHQVPPGFPIFLTWNLKGAIPERVAAMLRRVEEQLAKEPRRADESLSERQLRHAKLLFAKRDRCLDAADKGPLYLSDPRAAAIVVESLLWGLPARYELWAYAVLGNHVHALLTPTTALEVVTQGIKGYTAYEINGLQEARGRVFWQDESYDHWARDDAEMARIIAYIENNPVVAGLCAAPADWPWSSAHWRTRLGWDRGKPFRSEWRETVLAAQRTSGFPA